MSPAAPQVSIVIPCFNEEQTVARLCAALDEVVAKLEGAGRPTEVIVIDDGSSDDTFPRLRAAAGSRAWLRLVRFRRNFGQTAAMAAGFERARGAYVVPMDADLQNDPQDIPLLLARLEEGYDIVAGWRKNRQDKAITRRLPSTIANWLIGHASHGRAARTTCMAARSRAYRREVLEPVRLYGEMHRFIPVYAKWGGARITEQVVRHHARQEGTSKYGLGRTLRVLLDLMTVKFLGDYSTKPLYLFGFWGVVCIILGVISGAVTLIEKFVSGAFAHRNPLLLLAVMLFVVGMQLIGMGLVAELLVRTYHESQHKSVYIVGEEVNGPAGRPRARPAPWVLRSPGRGQATDLGPRAMPPAPALVRALASAARRHAAWILVCLAYLFPFPYYERLNNPNENVRVWATRAIVEQHGVLNIDQTQAEWGYVNDKAKSQEHVYSGKAPGATFLGVPVLFLHTKLRHLLGKPSPDKRDTTFWLRLLAVKVPLCVFLFFFARHVERVTRSRAARDLLVVGLGLGTLVYPYGQMFVGHALAAAAAFGSYMLLAPPGVEPGRPAATTGRGAGVGRSARGPRRRLRVSGGDRLGVARGAMCARSASRPVGGVLRRHARARVVARALSHRAVRPALALPVRIHREPRVPAHRAHGGIPRARLAPPRRDRQLALRS